VIYLPNKNIKVILARDENGWNKNLESYILNKFNNNYEVVLRQADMKEKCFLKFIWEKWIWIDRKISKHNEAASNAVLFLYGQNKWIADNNIDSSLTCSLRIITQNKRQTKLSRILYVLPDSQYENASEVEFCKLFK